MTSRWLDLPTARRLAFGWLYWLIGPPGNRTGIYAAILIVGLVMSVSLAIMLTRAPARFFAIDNPVTTMSVDVGCERLVTGGTYFIEVGGKRHECTGSDSWCPFQKPVPVVYDRARPEHCRAAHNVGRPSKWELAALLNNLAGIALALAVFLIRPDGTQRWKSLAGHVLFVVCLVIALGSWQAGLSVMK